MSRFLTDTEIYQAIEADCDSSEDTDSSEDESSDSEVDLLEENSDIDDEQSGSTDSEDQPDEDQIIYTGKDGTEWRSYPYPPNSIPHIRGGINKVKLPPGKRVDTILETFLLYFDDEIIDIIVKHTNSHAEKSIDWQKTDRAEIKAFIGLLISAGINKQGVADYKEFWHPLFGNPIFRACMSLRRFTHLMKNIRFDDKNSRSERRSRDKFAPFREVWNCVNKNLTKYYKPGRCLTIDEQLVPYRGRVSFRQYIPSKPDKYGMKIFWICDSITNYPLKGIPYLGKEGRNRATNVAHNIVLELCESYANTYRNVTFDNFFTSYELAQSLLAMGLTSVGTLRKNKRCIPSLFLPQKNRDVSTNLFGFRKNITIVSYTPQKNRAVIFLSTFHKDQEVDEESNKSAVNLYYNSTKGGVDTMDLMAHSFSSRRKTNRWPMAQFFNIIDICGIAAKTVWLNLQPKWNESKPAIRRKLFLKDLIRDLVAPHILRRSTKYLSKNTRATINDLTRGPNSENSVGRESPTEKVRRRCYLCDAKKSRMSKQYCSLCKKSVCGEHSKKLLLCYPCINH